MRPVTQVMSAGFFRKDEGSLNVLFPERLPPWSLKASTLSEVKKNAFTYSMNSCEGFPSVFHHSDATLSITKCRPSVVHPLVQLVASVHVN